MNIPSFTLNGQTVSLADQDPQESLLRWLRRQQQTGTKEGCGDGDCGACTVALLEPGADGHGEYRSANSCLLPMGQLAGRSVVTVEGLAQGDRLHPVQAALVESAGSQCGYCTPGFVMSLFVGYYENALDDHAIEGNLCRCTGYRPIRAAAAALAAAPRVTDHHASARGEPRAALPASHLDNFHNPISIDAALALKSAHPSAAWIAGATDVGVSLSRGLPAPTTWIALDRIAALQQIEVAPDCVRIGAGVALSRLETELAGIFPALDQLLPWFAARQVKNRATLGGNLGSASPIGDLLPWLLAHDAVIEVRGPGGARELAIDSYFCGYRQTLLAADELIVAVRVPRSKAWQAAYKVAKRQADDISIVAAVFVLAQDADTRVSHVRLAFGGVAAVPTRALAVESWLLGRTLDAATLADAANRLRDAFTPLSDHRASAGYRRELCASLFCKFVAEQVHGAAS